MDVFAGGSSRRKKLDPLRLAERRRLGLDPSKRGHRNQLGFAAQICPMRFPGRALALNETPSALLHFLGDQLGVSPAVFADYARRDETRREHLIEVQAYLSLRAAAREDRRFALLAAIDAATAIDKGLPIGEAVIKSFRDRGVLLPSAERMDRIGGARHCAQARSSGDIEWADARTIGGARRAVGVRFGNPPNAIWLARRLVGFSGRRQSQRPSRSP